MTTVAGGHPFDADDNGDGGPPRTANISARRASRSAPTGRSTIAEADRVRRVGTDGTVTTVAGGGGDSAAGASRVPAGSVHFDGAKGVDVAPDGALLIATQSGLNRVSRPFPSIADGALLDPVPRTAQVLLVRRHRPPPAHAGRRSTAAPRGASPTTPTAA